MSVFPSCICRCRAPVPSPSPSQAARFSSSTSTSAEPCFASSSSSEIFCVICVGREKVHHLPLDKTEEPSTPCIPLVAKGEGAWAGGVPGASSPSLSHLIPTTRAGAQAQPLLTASLNFSSVMSLRLIMTLK